MSKPHPVGFGSGGKRAKAPTPSKGISPLIFYPFFAVLFGTNVLTATALLMSPDIVELVGGKNEAVLWAYEDRIAQLRVEVDRLHSRQYAQAGDLNLQLQELAQQQEILSEQHQYVRNLTEQAVALGLAPAPLPLSREPLRRIDAAMNAPILQAPLPRDKGVAAASAAIEEMMHETRGALTAISEAAEQSTDEILAELSAIGIRPALPDTAAAGVGGPFLPPTDEAAEALRLIDDANAVASALARFKAVQGAIDDAPIHRPITSAARMSSNFGNRRDPFNGRRAFHAGIDFAMPSGTKVLSAGAGKVSFVGQRSGYGNVVEVSHGNGLITRYAHLSSFLVDKGEIVATGTPIAKVGSTGRSTGPHLHFEVRKDDKPLDPARFIAAGRKLERYVGG